MNILRQQERLGNVLNEYSQADIKTIHENFRNAIFPTPCFNVNIIIIYFFII